MSLNCDVGAVLQRHGYSTLPAPLENSCLAVSLRIANGIACADVLVYREVNGRGETLKDEAALLVEALPRISQQLRLQPDLLSPNAEPHVVTFLGKRVHLLVGGDRRPLRCCLFPLLVLSSTTASKVPTSREHTNLPCVPANELDQFMGRQHRASVSKCPAVDAWLLHFRRAQQLLGAALLAFFSLSGFSLLLTSLGWFAAGMLAFILAALSPLAFLLSALRHFHRFECDNPSGILIAPEFAALAVTDSAQKSGNQAGLSSSRVFAPNQQEQSASWTPANTAAFLLDSMQSAMTACLSAYQAGNWRAYAGYLTSLLVNGLRLVILKHTGRIENPQTDKMLDQLPATANRGELDAWLHRLTTARQGHPLTTVEVHQAAYFVAQMLRQFHVMPAPWEAQILRTIPRPQHRALSTDGSVELPLPRAVMPTTPISQSNHSPEPLDFQRSSATAAPEKMATTSMAPTATMVPQNLSVSPTLSSSESEGVPLNVLSERDLDLLVDMIRAGASPYLFVFGNRYLAHWKTLRQMIDQTAQLLDSQVNVVVFPGLGDQKIDPKVVEFYHRFRMEGAPNPSALPLICALSRAVLLHILENNLPVPAELVVDPNPEKFLDHVRSVIATAQAYQVDLADLKDEESMGGESLSPAASPSPLDLLSQFDSIPAGNPRSAPARTSSSPQSGQSLLTNVDDVVEEVDHTPTSPLRRRVTEMDVASALERRELATMVPVALAVVHLPEHQHVVDALEAAAQQEDYLVVEYVDSSRYPDASEVLHTEAGTVRLRYNGTERLLKVPEADHLLASIRQLRATTGVNPASDQSAEAASALSGVDSPHLSKGRKRSKNGQPRRTLGGSASAQSGG